MFGELQCGFQDVAFLPSNNSFALTFLENIGRDYYIVTTTCPITVDGSKKVHALLKLLLPQHNFLWQSNFLKSA